MEFRKQTMPGRAGVLSSNVRFNSPEEEKLLRELVVRYPFALQLFDKPPQGDIQLENFVDYAMERLKVLRIIENVMLKSFSSKNAFYLALADALMKENLTGYLRKTQPSNGYASFVDYFDRQKDHISHFVLRLAYCKTEELRNWFIKYECELFEFRFDNEMREVICSFLKANDLLIQPISASERARVIDKIRRAHYLPDRFISDSTEFYKVPFYEILDLVGKRRVYLEGGFGYVSIKGMASVVSTYFRQHLTRCLRMMSEWVGGMEGEEHRLQPWINTFHLRYLGKDYSKCEYEGVVTAENVDELSASLFPLCMKEVHGALRKKHHLKHTARLQYSLFLKGIGMSLEEVTRMWREEFTKTIDSDKFDRQYGYGLRHSYGKEGKRANYTPYSCLKIINGLSTPGPGDDHGCPFKNLDIPSLKRKLGEMRIADGGAREVIDLVSKGHYQLGCTRVFELQRKVSEAQVQPINHPVEYFEKGLPLLKQEKPGTNTSGAERKYVPRPPQLKSTVVYSHQMGKVIQSNGSTQTSVNSSQSELSQVKSNDDCEDDDVEMESIMSTLEY